MIGGAKKTTKAKAEKKTDAAAKTSKTLKSKVGTKKEKSTSDGSSVEPSKPSLSKGSTKDSTSVASRTKSETTKKATLEKKSPVSKKSKSGETPERSAASMPGTKSPTRTPSVTKKTKVKNSESPGSSVTSRTKSETAKRLTELSGSKTPEPTKTSKAKESGGTTPSSGLKKKSETKTPEKSVEPEPKEKKSLMTRLKKTVTGKGKEKTPRDPAETKEKRKKSGGFSFRSRRGNSVSKTPREESEDVESSHASEADLPPSPVIGNRSLDNKESFAFSLTQTSLKSQESEEMAKPESEEQTGRDSKAESLDPSEKVTELETGTPMTEKDDEETTMAPVEKNETPVEVTTPVPVEKTETPAEITTPESVEKETETSAEVVTTESVKKEMESASEEMTPIAVENEMETPKEEPEKKEEAAFEVPALETPEKPRDDDDPDATLAEAVAMEDTFPVQPMETILENEAVQTASLVNLENRLEDRVDAKAALTMDTTLPTSGGSVEEERADDDEASSLSISQQDYPISPLAASEKSEEFQREETPIAPETVSADSVRQRDWKEASSEEETPMVEGDRIHPMRQPIPIVTPDPSSPSSADAELDPDDDISIANLDDLVDDLESLGDKTEEQTFEVTPRVVETSKPNEAEDVPEATEPSQSDFIEERSMSSISSLSEIDSDLVRNDDSAAPNEEAPLTHDDDVTDYVDDGEMSSLSSIHSGDHYDYDVPVPKEKSKPSKPKKKPAEKAQPPPSRTNDAEVVSATAKDAAKETAPAVREKPSESSPPGGRVLKKMISAPHFPTSRSFTSLEDLKKDAILQEPIKKMPENQTAASTSSQPALPPQTKPIESSQPVSHSQNKPSTSAQPVLPRQSKPSTSAQPVLPVQRKNSGPKLPMLRKGKAPKPIPQQQQRPSPSVQVQKPKDVDDDVKSRVSYSDDDSTDKEDHLNQAFKASPSGKQTGKQHLVGNQTPDGLSGWSSDVAHPSETGSIRMEDFEEQTPDPTHSDEEEELTRDTLLPLETKTKDKKPVEAEEEDFEKRDRSISFGDIPNPEIRHPDPVDNELENKAETSDPKTSKKRIKDKTQNALLSCAFYVIGGIGGLAVTVFLLSKRAA